MKITKHTPVGHVDGEAAVKEALKLLSRRIEQPSRRAFLERSLTLGGLAMLGGCSITSDAGVEAALGGIELVLEAEMPFAKVRCRIASGLQVIRDSLAAAHEHERKVRIRLMSVALLILTAHQSRSRWQIGRAHV